MNRCSSARSMFCCALALVALGGCDRSADLQPTSSTSPTGRQVDPKRQTASDSTREKNPVASSARGNERGGNERVGNERGGNERGGNERGGNERGGNERVGNMGGNVGGATAGRERAIAEAQQQAERGEFDRAAELLQPLLLANPEDVEVLFLLANVKAAAGNLDQAVEILDSIPAQHPQAGIPALGQSADWCMRLQRYDEAENRYRQVLERVPDAAPARRQLAFLLNRQGRRHEAAEQVRALCELGNVRQDELHSLIMLNHAMWDDPATDPAVSQVVYAPIGASGVARKLFTDGKYAEAADKIHDQVAQGTATPAVTAFYGRIVAEAQDDERFLWWLGLTDNQTREFADYWAAVGTYLISQRRFEEATRALLEAADRDPTDKNSIGRLGQTLLTLGDEAGSQRWLDRWDNLNESVKANNRVSETDPPDPGAILELADLLEKLDRPLEAVLWRSVAALYRGDPKSELAEWNKRRQELVAEEKAFASKEHRLCGIDLNAFPVPRIDPGSVKSPLRTTQTKQQRVSPASFVNVAQQLEIDHAYQVAARPQTEGFAIHQTYGGAVVAFDYDRDGRSDLYFAQGGSDPPEYRGTQVNRLYRNVSRSRRNVSGEQCQVHDVSELAGAADDRYSMGATAGDWNQDGFPDLVISNLGADSLFINNGDGTFTHTPIVVAGDDYRVPASVAMADLTGDHLPDVFELAYVDDPNMIYRPKRNEKREVLNAMSPLQFDPGADRICVNDGRGGMEIRVFTTETKDVRTGLGLIVTDFNDQPGNEVFVGNDLFPDHLWVRQPGSQDWSDVAQALGCAFGIRGSKTASMGIAAADFDNTGTIDLHITNYQDRNASLFLNLGQAFLERNVQYGLAADSRAVLGFGTQAIDYDNDGDRDLVVTNGHIENSLSIPDPYEQPAQLFANLGGRFELVSVDDASGYWKDHHLGRGLARLDFNRDGREDFVVTHLGETSALLLNQTATEHHWLQLSLVGVDSERDAIGARIEIRYSDQESTDWVIAGDGYFCKNESITSFGLGDAEHVDQMVVTWPTGRKQTFDGIKVDRRYTVVEGQAEPFEVQ